ncbi:MAG: hypothetical protein Q9170_005841 [Blastenia crenularia]
MDAPPQNQPYHQTFADNDLFANTVYALSNLENKPSQRCSFSAYSQGYFSKLQERIDTLNQFSLLLAHKPGDAAAIALRCECTGISIFWARDDTTELTEEEAEYLQKIERVLRTSKNIGNDTLELVLPICRRKIISRIKKLAKECPSGFMVDDEDPSTVSLRKYLIKKGAMSDHPLRDSMNAFAEDVRSVTDASNLEDIARIIRFSYWLTSPGFYIKSWKYYVERIRKVGDHYAACVMIEHNVQRLGPKIRATVTLQRILPPAPTPVRIHGDTVTALNTFAAHHQIAPIEDFKKLKKAYPDAKEGPNLPLDLTPIQHCELTIALHVWQIKQQKSAAGNLEIGHSKTCCYYCENYIQLFNAWAGKQPEPCQMALSHRKAKYPNTCFIPPVPEEVKEKMLGHIGNRVRDVFDWVAKDYHGRWWEVREGKVALYTGKPFGPDY